MSEKNISRAELVGSMLIFGTIGIFRKNIPLGSGTLAFARSIIGVIFLVAVSAVRRKGMNFSAVKANGLKLILSGAFIGFNWILLFESYNYTSVAVATLCYYMAPLFVILVSPMLFGEKFTLKKVICIISAVMGIVLISGAFTTGMQGFGELRGIVLGLSAAVLYASVIILNKTVHGVEAFDRTIVQLAVSAVEMFVYTIIVERPSLSDIVPKTAVFLVIIGVVHTGLAYALYFGSMEKLSAQSVAVMSYIDPISAVLLSALFLREHIGMAEIIGAVLVLGGAIVSEIEYKHKKSS